MKKATIEKREKWSELIYVLIYPAILGSMLYSLVPIECSKKYLSLVLIAAFYLIDYYNLYFNMKSRFTEVEQLSKTYIFYDLFVSILMLFAFEYSKENIYISLVAIALIPICFRGYSKPLNYCNMFYNAFALIGILVLLTVVSNYFFHYMNDLEENLHIAVLACFLILYGLHVFVFQKVKKKVL